MHLPKHTKGLDTCEVNFIYLCPKPVHYVVMCFYELGDSFP